MEGTSTVIMLALVLYAVVIVGGVLALLSLVCALFWRGMSLPVGFGLFWTTVCLLAIPAVRLAYAALAGFDPPAGDDNTRALAQLSDTITYVLLGLAWLVGLAVALALHLSGVRMSPPFALSGSLALALGIYVAAFVALLALPGLIQGQRQQGRVALAQAMRTGDMDAARRLLDAGVEILPKHPELGGRDPMSYAIDSEQVAVVALLIERGQRKNMVPLDGLSPAVKRGNLQIVTLFLDKGADVNQWRGAPLRVAAQGGRLDLIALLLDRGAQVNAADSLFGRTALIEAVGAKQPNADVVDLLLARGANPNTLTAGGGVVPTSALMIAASSDDAALVRRLLAAGADPSLDNGRGETALSMAERNNAAAAAAALRAAGAR